MHGLVVTASGLFAGITTTSQRRIAALSPRLGQHVIDNLFYFCPAENEQKGRLVLTLIHFYEVTIHRIIHSRFYELPCSAPHSKRFPEASRGASCIALCYCTLKLFQRERACPRFSLSELLPLTYIHTSGGSTGPFASWLSTGDQIH